MGFLLVGIVLLILKAIGFGPVASWSWWWVAAPFALAVVWWWFADSVGITQTRAARRTEARIAKRRQRAVENLDTNKRRKK